MRYIEKSRPLKVFTKAENSYYDNYNNLETMNNSDLRSLFTQFKIEAKLISNQKSKCVFLEKEQKGLCAYCEKIITSDKEDSHIEHIIPISLNPLLIFSYENLIISCNGSNNESCDKQENHSCGHNKSNTQLPLSPTKDADITDYFDFNKETGKILSSNKDSLKAEKTIEILNLDNRRLNAQRISARELFEEKYNSLMKNNTQEEAFYQLGYVSFLNYYYSNTKEGV